MLAIFISYIFNLVYFTVTVFDEKTCYICKCKIILINSFIQLNGEFTDHDTNNAPNDSRLLCMLKLM